MNTSSLDLVATVSDADGRQWRNAAVQHPTLGGIAKPRLLHRRLFYWFLFAGAWVFAADHQRLLPSWTRPLTLGMIALCTLLALRASDWRFGRLRWPAVMFALLLAFGAPGVMINLSSNRETSLLVMLGMFTLPVCVYAFPIRRFAIDPDGHVNRWMITAWIFVIAALYVAIYEPSGGLIMGPQHGSYILPILVLAPALRDSRVFVVAGLIAICLLFVYDPRTTVVLVMALSTVVVLGIRWIPTRLHRSAMVAGMIILASLPLIGDEGIRIVQSFSETVKTSMASSDNSEFRRNLLAKGWSEFTTSPFVGDMFQAESVIEVGTVAWDPVTRRYIPILGGYHNDFLEILVHGGVIGGVLFLFGYVGTIALAYRNVMLARRLTDMQSFWTWQLIIFVVLTSAAVALLFNPLLNELQACFFFYLALAEAHLGGRILEQRLQALRTAA